MYMCIYIFIYLRKLGCYPMAVVVVFLLRLKNLYSLGYELKKGPKAFNLVAMKLQWAPLNI